MLTLDARLAGLHHLLVLDSTCSPADLAALARSRYPGATWLADDILQLEEEVTLTGPWPLDDEVRRTLDLPGWATQAWLCFCQQDRSGPLPLALEGTDPVLDAYPEAVPTGRELDTLRFLQAVARRLGGGVHLAGTAVVLLPDPQSAVDLTVYGQEYVVAEEFLEAAGREDLQVDATIRKSFSLWAPAIPGTSQGESGVIHVLHQRAPVPFALSGMEWAERARMTSIRWHPPHSLLGRLQRAERHRRLEVIRQIEALARIAVELSGGGVAIDDDGFVVAL
nr:hypothetical protein [Actinomycetales bacterium]